MPAKKQESYELRILQMLINSEWWKYLQRQIEEQIKDLEHDVLTKVSSFDNERVYTEHDLRRIRISMAREILETPESLKRDFETTQGTAI